MTGQHNDANFQVIRSLGLQFLDGDVPDFVKGADIDRDRPSASQPLNPSPGGVLRVTPG